MLLAVFGELQNVSMTLSRASNSPFIRRILLQNSPIFCMEYLLVSPATAHGPHSARKSDMLHKFMLV
jgi:hypothetical protein